MLYLDKKKQTGYSFESNIGTQNNPIFVLNPRYNFTFLPSKFTISLSDIVYFVGCIAAGVILLCAMILLGISDDRLTLQASANYELKKEFLMELKKQAKESGLTSSEKAKIQVRIEKLESDLKSDLEFLTKNYKSRIKAKFTRTKKNTISPDELEVKYDFIDMFDGFFIFVFCSSFAIIFLFGRIHKLAQFPNDNL